MNNNLTELEYKMCDINDLRRLFASDYGYIYICKPSTIFKNYKISKDKSIEQVDWNNIDKVKLKYHKNYVFYPLSYDLTLIDEFISDFQNKIIYNIMRHYNIDDNINLDYVFVEEIKNTFTVRAIVNYNNEEFKIAFNPEFYKNITNDNELVKKLK